jgi:hypothetical protein
MATMSYITASVAGVVLLRSSAKYVSTSAPHNHKHNDGEKLDIDAPSGTGSCRRLQLRTRLYPICECLVSFRRVPEPTRNCGSVGTIADHTTALEHNLEGMTFPASQDPLE